MQIFGLFLRTTYKNIAPITIALFIIIIHDYYAILFVNKNCRTCTLVVPPTHYELYVDLFIA